MKCCKATCRKAGCGNDCCCGLHSRFRGPRKTWGHTRTENVALFLRSARPRSNQVKYSVKRTNRDDATCRFSTYRAKPGGRGRILPRRIARFSRRGQEICFAGLAGGGLRKPAAYALSKRRRSSRRHPISPCPFDRCVRDRALQTKNPRPHEKRATVLCDRK